MATQKKRRQTKIKFELTRTGIGSIAIICFCIFLWMFLFGVWAGQSLLYPPVSKNKIVAEVQDSGKGKEVLEVIRLEARKKKKMISR